MKSINVDKHINKINFKDPLHLMMIGGALIGVFILRNILIFIAIGIFVLAIYQTRKVKQNEENN
jgi:uncharacterized membrane protein